MKAIFLAGVLSSFALGADPVTPNAKLTPGMTFLDVSVERVCQKGYANAFHGGVRNVPESVKRKVFIAYFGKVPTNTQDYEIDHLCSLCLGGSNDQANLWPQSYTTSPFNAHVKDRLEDHLYTNVRHDLRMNGHAHAAALLKTYQTEIARDWTACYTKYLGDPAGYTTQRHRLPHQD